MRRFLSLSLMALLSIGATACGGSDEPTAPPPTIEQTTFAPGLGVDLTAMTKASTGFYYQDSRPGNGDMVRLGDSLQVVFTGSLANGTVFAQSNPLAFRLGATQIMVGWLQGLPGAPVTGRRRLIIPPELGFGSHAIIDAANGKVVVPANSVLVYDIDITAVVH